jgi:hypothetical protein
MYSINGKVARNKMVSYYFLASIFSIIWTQNELLHIIVFNFQYTSVSMALNMNKSFAWTKCQVELTLNPQ